MTLEQIHILARKFDRKARMAALILALALIIVGFVKGLQWQMFDDPLRRIGIALVAIGLPPFVYLTWRVLFPEMDPAEPAGVYLRRRLQRSLANARGGWALTVAPLLPGMLVTLYGGIRYNSGPQWAPYVVFVGAFVVAFAVTRISARRISAELRRLDALLKS